MYIAVHRITKASLLLESHRKFAAALSAGTPKKMRESARASTGHDGDDFECADDGCFDDCDAERGNCLDKPVDELTEERCKKAWQFTRGRTSKLTKGVFG